MRHHLSHQLLYHHVSFLYMLFLLSQVHPSLTLQPGGLIRVPKAAPPPVALHSHFVFVLAAGAAELVEGTGSNVLDSTGLAFAVLGVVAAQLAIASVVLAASVLASVEPAFAVLAIAATALVAVAAVAASGGRNKIQLAVCWASITHVSCR